MLEHGNLNPAINSLLSRIRPTTRWSLPIAADRGFPYWPMIETVDIPLVDGVPRVLEVAGRDSRTAALRGCLHGGGM
jgi:D-ribose pyranase